MVSPRTELPSSQHDLRAGGIVPAGTGNGTGPVPGTETETENQTDDREVETAAAARVVFFSDAVVAIAITLLALALPLPHSTGDTSNVGLLHLLARDRDQYYAFLLSFLVIGTHWAAHRQVFRYVGKVNHRIGQLTVLWLLMVVLIPFAARLLAASGGFGVRFSFYVLIQVIALACLVLMNRVIVHAGLLRPGGPETARHPDNVASLTIIVVFALSVPVAFFTAWAFAPWAAIPLLVRAIRWYRARGPRVTAAADPEPSTGKYPYPAALSSARH